jgi:hypothetical protein
MCTLATVLSGLTVTSTGPFMFGSATARRPISATAAVTWGFVTSSPLTTTTAGICPPGKAASMRS